MLATAAPVVGRAATNYHVAVSGNNTAAGTALQPWATPGYGSKQLQPGDALIIHPGTYIITNYYDDIIWMTQSGTSDAWITVRGAPGSRPVIMGTSNISHAVNIADRNYLLIENLELCSLRDTPYSGGMRAGIVGLGNGHSNIVIRDIEVHHVEEMGISMAGNCARVTIDNAHIHHTGYTAIGGDYLPEGQPGWEHILITNCLLEDMGLYRNGEEVQSTWDRPDGIGFETSIGPVEIADTTARRGYGDGLDSKSRRTWIHHCVVADNYGDGIKLWGKNSRLENSLVYGTGWTLPEVTTPWCLLVIGTTDTNGTFEIRNCTFFDDNARANNHYLSTIQYDESTVPINLTLQNNIFSGLARILVQPAVNLTATHNLFDIRASSVQIEHGIPYSTTNLHLLGPENTQAPPGIIRAQWGPHADFHLRPQSQAVNHGQTNDLQDDLDHAPRTVDTMPDAGAFEFDASTDIDGDQLPDWWERLHYYGPTNALPHNDDDGDRTDNREEYIAGTSPTNSSDVFQITIMNRCASNDIALHWPSVSGRIYHVQARTSHHGDFTPIATNLAATPPINTRTQTMENPIQFFGIGVVLER
jgi:hypothetical protein